MARCGHGTQLGRIIGNPGDQWQFRTVTSRLGHKLDTVWAGILEPGYAI